MLLTWLALASGGEAARQPGKDGPLTVSGVTTVNTYAVLAADANAGATSIGVNLPAGGPNNLNPVTLTANDLLLIIQIQGATIDTSDTATYGTVTSYNNAGKWEFVTVSGPGVGGPPTYTIPLDGLGLKNSYTAAGRVQVIRVPQYSSVTVNAGGSITTPIWYPNPSVYYGGVVALDVQNTITIDGNIRVSQRGFWGGAPFTGTCWAATGYRSAFACDGAEKGESVAGSGVEYDGLGGRYGRGAPANGGGGGNAHDAAGGGGANPANGLVWTGQGNPDRGPGNIYDPAWNLDPSLSATSTSSGGGRGGYSFSFSDENALTTAPGDPAWLGDERLEAGGLGGHPVPYDAALTRVFLGGGGGAGYDSNGEAGVGGRGAGILFLFADAVAGTGSIFAFGGVAGSTSGSHFDAPGGGGAGGTVVIRARTSVFLGVIDAAGGAGGDQGPVAAPEAEGGGGGGGGGYIYVCAPTVAIGTRTADGGPNGITQSTALSEFPPNGGTRGAPGVANAGGNCIGPGPSALTFTEVSASAGLNVAGFKDGGLAWGDFNNDSCPDAIVNTSDGVLATRLYAQDASGSTCLGTFADVTQCLASGLLANVYDRAIAFGDYDNDGNLDFARSHNTAVEVYRSNGAGVTVDPSCPAGSFAWSRFGAAGSPTQTLVPGNSEGMGWIDFDMDGDLDLFIQNGDGLVMATNNPTGTLTVDTTTGLPVSGSGNGDYAAVADYDVDGDVDVLARQNDGRDLWYNDGTAPLFFTQNLNFTEIANNGDKAGVAFCDFDSDRDLDLFWTDVPANVNQIWRNNGGVDGAVTWTAMGTLPTGVSDVDGVSCGDFDHDGDVDLMLNASSGAVGDYLFRNDGAFSFVNVSPASFGPDPSVAGALADYDRDGDLDLFINQNDGNQLWRNETNDKNYLMVRALHNVGVAERDAIGATVSLESCAGAPLSLVQEVSGGSGHGSQNEPLVHFGLRQSSMPFGPSGTYVVRVKFVGGGIVQKAVVPASLGCYQMVTIRNTDADDLAACSATAVTLSSFTATAADSTVDLAWETASELSNLGFHLYRSTAESGPFTRITPSLVPGLGSSPVGARYSYRDSGLANGTTYFYLLEDVETTGATKRHGPVSATPAPGSAASALSNGGEGNLSLITYGAPETSSIRVLSRTRTQAVVELTTEGFFALPREDGSVEVTVPGFLTVEGFPAKGHWLEAVAGRKVEILSVRPSRVERLGLRPSASSALEIIASRDGTQRLQRSSISKSFSESSGIVPAKAARIAEVAFQGEVKKALLEMVPIGWDGARGQLVFARTLTVVVGFRGREPSEVASSDGSRGRRRSGARPARGVAYRLATTERGLYAVRYEDVFDARARRAGAAKSVRLSRLGSPVPFHIEPATPRFTPGSTLYFLSEGADANPYGNEAVYELEIGVSGERMLVEDAAPPESPVGSYQKRTDLEEQRYYQAGLVERDDPWLWDMLLAPSAKSFPFFTSEVAASGAPARLEVLLQGASDLPESPDHHVRFRVNGAPVGEDEWDGKASRRLEIDLPPGVLREGENAVEIENVGDTGAPYSMIFLDRFSVRFRRMEVAEGGVLEGTWTESGSAAVTSVGAAARVLDVSESSPRWLAGASLRDDALRFGVQRGRSYLVVDAVSVRRPEIRRGTSARWRRENRQADYVVIGPRDLLGAAAPLFDYRRAQGLRVAAVPIDELYDEFGYGETRPEAVRDFLSYAFHNWQGGIRYALLLGDASYDFKDYLKTGAANRVPGLPIRTRYLWTASDPAYASVNGDDLLPDIAIGRLPASDVRELEAMVAKILAYERGDSRLGGPAVLVTDNPDSAGDFDRDADELAQSVLASRDVRRISLAKLGVAETRNAILGAFEESPSLVSYMGHGGIHLWASENVFDTSSVPLLSQGKAKPVVVTLDCLNGYFHFPYFDSLGEELLEAEDRGALAVVAPSGLSLNEPAHVFHKALLEELTGGGHRRLGDAIASAQATFLKESSFAELLAIYHLFGDPALSLR